MSDSLAHIEKARATRGSLFQRILRESSMALTAASAFVIAAAVTGTARAGSEHPIQGALVPSRGTDVSAKYLGSAADEGEENDNAAMDSGGIEGVTLSVGSVVSVSAADGIIIIEHRPIPRLYMESMTMIFRVKDRSLLVGLTAGDKIRFQVEREAGGFVVMRLEHSN